MQNKKFTIKKPVRLIELFGGIGSQAKALKNIGADFEHYRLCEIDKFAVKSYNAIHGTCFSTSDITKLHGKDLGITHIRDFVYILTYSFPCTDLSLAGGQAGMKKGSGTRSGLLWEVERLLKETKNLPQILLMENVPQVIGKKNKEDFLLWLNFLESMGYKNYNKLLNAKDYGIPQTRNRCFMISLLGNYSYEFPEKIPLTLRLKDFLEDSVDEKYYLSDKLIKCFERNNKKNNFTFKTRTGNDLACTITTKAGQRRCDNFIIEAGNLNNSSWLRPMNVVLDTNGICSTINTCGGGHRQPKILTEKRIRKLTPLECFTLMGFDTLDYKKCRDVGISDTQIYKQSGNSIVVKVLEAIFKQLF